MNAPLRRGVAGLDLGDQAKVPLFYGKAVAAPYDFGIILSFPP
jgi:hypothetical protein